MSHLPLAGGPEFDRVRAIAAALGPHAASLGDDCALLEVAGRTLALSTDVSVEDVHFRRAWLSLEEIG
jgi:thiamine-monophosphate kinase